MDARTDRIDLSRLAVPAFVVVLGAFVGLRMLAVEPWAMPAFDVYAYWATRDGFDYSIARQGPTGAYLYSPAFAQVIAPLEVGGPAQAGQQEGSPLSAAREAKGQRLSLPPHRLSPARRAAPAHSRAAGARP